MASHWEVAEPKGGRTEGVEVRLEVWAELPPEVPGTEGTEVRREAEVPLTHLAFQIKFSAVKCNPYSIDSSSNIEGTEIMRFSFILGPLKV